MTNNQRKKILRQMPCCCGCGRPPPSDVAHSNWAEHGKCKGKKADDKYTIPLNRVCHQKFDQYKEKSREDAKVWFLARLEQTNKDIEVLLEGDKTPF